MAIISRENSLGAWAFLLGIIVSVLVGIFAFVFFPLDTLSSYSKYIYSFLVLLGIIVGLFIRVSSKDAHSFMISGAILVVVSKFGMDSVRVSLIGIGLGEVVTTTFGALLALFVPATIIISVKHIFSIAQV